MDIDGETHVVVVTASWNSGKFVVELNGYERFHQTVSGVFTYAFKFQDRFFKIVQQGDQLLLNIDTVPFNQFSARAKAAQAALLKSYESRARPQAPQTESGATSRSDSPEPFSGDLAKRLGKKDKKTRPDYIPQADDDEDFFAAPVNIQSFVKPADVSELTVIPNLIEFEDAPAIPRVPLVPIKKQIVAGEPKLGASDASQAATPGVPDDVAGAVENKGETPLTGPVTPRDKISPSKLVNPFDAFDELTLPAAGEDGDKNRVDNPFI